MFDPEDKKNADILDYCYSKNVLIIDPTSNVRTILKRFLSTIGVQALNIKIAGSYEEAREEFDNTHPRFVFTSINIGEHSGMEFLEENLKLFPNRLEAGFFLLCEKDAKLFDDYVLGSEVDSCISAPYTIENIQTKVLDEVIKKARPNKSASMVAKCKQIYFSEKYEETVTQIDQVVEKIPQAVGLKYYSVLALEHLGQPEKAVELLEEVQNWTTQDYKILTKLQDVYTEKKDYKKAYEVQQKLMSNYPLPTRKLGDFIKLSLMNQQYQDIFTYSDFWEEHVDDLEEQRKVILAGLATCGNHLFKSGNKDLGAKALETCAKYVGNHLNIIELICQVFIDNDMLKEAETHINKFVEINPESKELHILRLRLLHKNKQFDKVLTIGRELIEKELTSSKLYITMIKSTIAMGRKKEFVEDLVFEATRAFPKKKAKFDKYLAKLES